MKKSFLAIAIVGGFLTACNSAPKTTIQDPNALPLGMMEPVDGSGASQGSYSWPSDIKPASMPDAMK